MGFNDRSANRQSHSHPVRLSRIERLEEPIPLLRLEPDAGIGFKPEERDRLFEAFYTTKPNGMGMGLAISRSIIEAHAGRLWAEPNSGPGATFLISLPAAGPIQDRAKGS